MNIQPYIIINGVSSRTIAGLIVTKLPPISKPLERTLIETVDGRDGDIITPLGYSAYDKPFSVGLAGNYNIDEVIVFFNSEGVITFSNEPDKYYRFKIIEQIDFERLLRFKTADAVAHVQPFKLSTTEQPLTPTLGSSPNEITVTNSGNIIARPTIEITGAGVVTLALNGVNQLEITLDDDGETIIIDSEKMNAYAQDGLTLLNRQVVGDYDKIKLNKGANTLTLTGNATALTISKYSRWL